jgi:hypothetical protein
VEQQLVYHVRGLNPSASTIQSYVSANQGIHWYLDAVIRHESRINSTTYNQFNPESVGVLGIGWDDYRFAPNRHDDPGDTFGWGLTMQTGAFGTQSEVDPQLLWHWKDNVIAGKEELDNKLSLATAYFEAVERTFPTEWEEPPLSYTPPGRSTALTSLEAATIQLYNGASIVRELDDPFGGTDTYISSWRFDENASSGNRWTFVPNSNNYVYKVIGEYEN